MGCFLNHSRCYNVKLLEIKPQLFGEPLVPFEDKLLHFISAFASFFLMCWSEMQVCSSILSFHDVYPWFTCWSVDVWSCFPLSQDVSVPKTSREVHFHSKIFIYSSIQAKFIICSFIEFLGKLHFPSINYHMCVIDPIIFDSVQLILYFEVSVLVCLIRQINR
jgi:hypothetical protein